MKRITLLAGVLLAFCYIQAQEAEHTRGQMMDLFYKAQKAEIAGNKQEALEIYKTILSVDANLSTPYLKMADIYAADEGNQQSMAAAAALYRKYLALQPDDENAAAITKKAADLEQRTSYGVDLNKLLYIGQEDAQQVFATKARPGLRARNKEELVQQVNTVDSLSDRAQAQIDAGNTQGAIQNLEQLKEQVDPSSPLYSQASMQLADAYSDQGDVQKMKETLTSAEENMNINENLSQDINTNLNDATSFGEDICGVWVSDLAYNDATPYLAVEIQKDNKSPQKYNATILPQCILAQKYGMYTGKQYNYEPKFNANDSSYFACSTINTVNSDENNAHFYFGNKKFIGTSAETADNIQNVVNPAIGNTAKNISSIYGDNSKAGAAAELGNTLAQGLFTWLANQAKTTDTGLDLIMQRLFSGCANANLVHSTVVTRTSSETESVDSMQIKLYKLYPEDKILFAAEENELFGYRTFTKEENQNTEEYKQLQVSKNRGDFNKQAYEKLSNKIADYCFTKAKEDPVFQYYANDCYTRFQYATQGLSYQTFSNKYGTFKGWVDLSGKMNGIGKCTLKDGTTYVGTWNNNKYSGKGKITFANGNIYDGIWKNDIPINGTITYANGDRYEGQCTYDKKTQQMNRDGQGTMVSANGETTSGKWKNDKLTK